MLYRPLFIAFAGLAVWIILWLLTPIDVIAPLRWNTIGFIALGYFFFAVGCIWAESSQPDVHVLLKRHRPWQGELMAGFFWSSLAIGALSMVLRYVDRVIIRGISYTEASDKVRDALANSDFSGASVIASIIMPVCFIPLILLLAARWEPRNWFKLILAGLLFCLPMLESLAQASRSIMLLTIMLGFFSVCLLKFNGQFAHSKLIVPAVGGIALTLLASTAIFSARLDSAGRNLDDSLYTSVYATAFQPNAAAQAGLESNNEIKAQVYRAVLPNSMYYLSGIYEFDLAYNRPDEQYFGYGAYIFYPYSRVLSSILGTESSALIQEEALIYRTGVFTSFFGPMWVDFGFVTFPILLMIGFALQRLAPLVASGKVNVLPIYLFGLVVIFYMPVFNFLVSGFGFFIFHGFALFALFSSFGIGVTTKQALAGAIE